MESADAIETPEQTPSMVTSTVTEYKPPTYSTTIMDKIESQPTKPKRFSFKRNAKPQNPKPKRTSLFKRNPKPPKPLREVFSFADINIRERNLVCYNTQSPIFRDYTPKFLEEEAKYSKPYIILTEGGRFRKKGYKIDIDLNEQTHVLKWRSGFVVFLDKSITETRGIKKYKQLDLHDMRIVKKAGEEKFYIDVDIGKNVNKSIQEVIDAKKDVNPLDKIFSKGLIYTILFTSGLYIALLVVAIFLLRDTNAGLTTLTQTIGSLALKVP